MNIQQTIQIDMMQPGGTHRTYAVEGDAGTRSVRLLLRQGTGEWIVPDGVSASLIYSKTDGTGGWYDKLPDGTEACTIDGSTITVALAPQVLSVPGVVSAAVILRDEQENQLTTFDFLIDVHNSPAKETISNDYYNLQFAMSGEEMQAWIARTEETLAGAVLFAQAQALTAGQQDQARRNIGAASVWDLQNAIGSAIGGSY